MIAIWYVDARVNISIAQAVTSLEGLGFMTKTGRCVIINLKIQKIFNDFVSLMFLVFVLPLV